MISWIINLFSFAFRSFICTFAAIIHYILIITDTLLIMKKFLLTMTAIATFATGFAQKTLVLYYSETGTTKTVAELLQRPLHADIESIEPVEPYTGDFQETIQRGQREMQSGETPALKPLKSTIAVLHLRQRRPQHLDRSAEESAAQGHHQGWLRCADRPCGCCGEEVGPFPQREPFLMIDEVEEYIPGEMTIAYKNVNESEWYFKGHFPGNPIMPGVLIAESLAQAGAIAILSLEENKGKNALFGGIDKMKFKKMVVPGDRLKLEVKIIKKKRNSVTKLHKLNSPNISRISISKNLNGTFRHSAYNNNRLFRYYLFFHRSL